MDELFLAAVIIPWQMQQPFCIQQNITANEMNVQFIILWSIDWESNVGQAMSIFFK